MNAERASGIAFEVEYWRALLDELLEMNSTISDVAGSLSDVSVALVTIGVAPPEQRNEFAMDGMNAIQNALRDLRSMQPRIVNIVGLARGRHSALVAELEGDG